MANSTERRYRDGLKAMDEADDLFDLDVEEGDEPERRIRAGRVVKSDLHLLAMIESDACQVIRGSILYFGYGGRTKSGMKGEGIIRDHDHIESLDGSRRWASLSSAATELTGRKKTIADGWALAAIDDPARPGKYVSLSKVFMECWDQLGFTLEELEDLQRLADVMLERGMISEVERAMHEPKKAKTEKTSDKKAPAKKEPAKKGPAKRSPAKAPAKKAIPRKAPPTEALPTSHEEPTLFDGDKG